MDGPCRGWRNGEVLDRELKRQGWTHAITRPRFTALPWVVGSPHVGQGSFRLVMGK